MDAKSKIRLSGMKLYYPDVPLVVIGAKEYRVLAKTRHTIPGWQV